VIASNDGEIEIHPKYPGAPPVKIIKALRVLVSAGTKPLGPPYWDITSQTLIATIKPLLAASKVSPFKCRLTAHGVAPSKRYSLEILP